MEISWLRAYLWLTMRIPHTSLRHSSPGSNSVINSVQTCVLLLNEIEKKIHESKLISQKPIKSKIVSGRLIFWLIKLKVASFYCNSFKDASTLTAAFEPFGNFWWIKSVTCWWIIRVAEMRNFFHVFKTWKEINRITNLNKSIFKKIKKK